MVRGELRCTATQEVVVVWVKGRRFQEKKSDFDRVLRPQDHQKVHALAENTSNTG